MPREIRKRGKKNKKTQHEALQESRRQGREEHHVYSPGEPSWIVSSRETAATHPEAPFGYVDPDVKAYFRTVDEQIQSWQEHQIQSEGEGSDLDLNETKRVFFVAAFNEMSGKEKQLATDPECSVILERMAYSMDDFVLRVFMDRLSGSFEVLFKHRFSSHVCQTLLLVAADTISREVKDIFPSIPSSDKGELRTFTQLVLDLCEEICLSFNSLIMDPFASHVLRSLLLLLCPTILPEDSARKVLRSKRSMTWKAKKGNMKSVFHDSQGKAANSSRESVPSSFRDAANRFLRILRDGLDANEVRALAANKVACPLLRLAIEIEADHGIAWSPDSLMDQVLVGMIKAHYKRSRVPIEPSDYLMTLLRDPSSSHLLETLVFRCPKPVFDILWSTYFKGKLVRLAAHPVANFVVSKAIEHQDRKQLGETLEELRSSWSRLIKNSGAGVLRALIDRSRELGAHQQGVCEATFTAIGICDSDNKDYLVPCFLFLKSLEDYRAAPVFVITLDMDKKHEFDDQVDDQREPKTQGAIILQSLLRLDEPHCSMVVDSINSLSTEDVTSMAHHTISSRVLDTFLESSTVPFKAKRRFVMSLIGHYHSLVDDRIGRHIGARCWHFADPYLREKIARSLIPFEQFLTTSFYGKNFARNLNLYLLKRRPEEWRTLQSNDKTSSAMSTQPDLSVFAPSQTASSAASSTSQERSKKRGALEDEIDAVFKTVLGNKSKRTVIRHAPPHEIQQSTDSQMSEIIGAIRKAPRGESRRRNKKKKFHSP